MTGLSFKYGSRATGLASIAYPYRNCSILRNKQSVGWLQVDRDSAQIEVWFHIKQGSNNFKNIKLKKRFPVIRGDDYTEAKAWVRQYWNEIQKRYDLYETANYE